MRIKMSHYRASISFMKGTQKNGGTSTDAGGNYALAVANDNTVLIFSFVKGYEPQEVQVGSRNEINISLENRPKVTRRSTRGGVWNREEKRRDRFGGFRQIAGTDRLSGARELVQALQGRAAGVQIQANNGEPGSSFKVRIRGWNFH